MIRWKKNISDEFLNLTKIHGPIYTFWFGQKPSVIITDLEFAKEAFLEKKNEIAGRHNFKICKLIICLIDYMSN